MKKVFALFVAMALILSVGCGFAENTDNKITIWLESSFSEIVMEKMIERIEQFEAETGYDVDAVQVAATDFTQKLSATLEANSGIPDIIMNQYHRILNYYPEMIVADIGDLYAEIEESVGGFMDSCASTCILDGVARIIPFYTSCTLMYCRADKLQAAGYTEPPKTWDEVFEMAKAVSDPDNEFYGLGIGCGPKDEDCENTSRMIIWANGGAFYDAEGNITVDNDVTKWWVNYYKELYDEGVIPVDAPTWDAGGNNNTYLTGESCFVFNAATLANALRTNPDYAELNENTWIAAMPSGSAGAITGGAWSGFSIMEASQNKELAAELLRYLYDLDWYEGYTENISPVMGPAVKSVAEGEFWTSDPVNKAVVDCSNNATAYYGYAAEKTEDWVLGIKSYYTYTVTDFVNAVAVGGLSYEDALADYVGGIEDIQANLK